ncbi:MAG: hypothetical protein H0V17_31485 [Deltaproteobacteria bacterium]|nr:hypothetical protein [Deltaproteobacteria bacterium]
MTCDREIPRGYPRIAEPCNDGRIPNAKYQYHCLECAIEQQPKLVREILVSETFDEGQVPDATALKQELQDRIEALEAKKPVPPRRVQLGPDRQVESLMQQLYDTPDDRDVLAVLADALTERGDLRGELIVLDLALGPDEGDEDQENRRNELRYRLLPRVCRSEVARAIVTWGFGFIDHAVVGDTQPYGGKLFPDVWSHGSLRLLRELTVNGDPGDWLGSKFPALRRLAIGYGRLDSLPSSLPRLEELRLTCRVDRAGAELLAAVLGDRKLARIELGHMARPDVVRERLAQLCDELVTFTDNDRATW